MLNLIAEIVLKNFCRQSSSGNSNDPRAPRKARRATQHTYQASRASLPPSTLAAQNIQAAETELLAICKSQKLLAQADAALEPFVLDYLHYAMHAMEIAMSTAGLRDTNPAWTRTARACFWYAVWSDAPSMQLQYNHLIQPLAVFYGYAHRFRPVQTGIKSCHLRILVDHID